MPLFSIGVDGTTVRYHVNALICLCILLYNVLAIYNVCNL